MQFKSIDKRAAILIAIGIVPILAGIARLVQLSGGPIDLPHTSRILNAPKFAFILHVVGAVTFLTLGAFQFAGNGLPKRRRLHRINGRVVAVAAVTTGLTAIWLTLFYPHAAHDGTTLNVLRIMAGAMIAITTVLGVQAARARNFTKHKRWMMRAYALGLATGVQAFAVGLWHFMFENPAGLTRAALFGGCWLFCLLFVEYRLLFSALKPIKDK